jgi:hypothetical protein
MTSQHDSRVKDFALPCVNWQGSQSALFQTRNARNDSLVYSVLEIRGLRPFSDISRRASKQSTQENQSCPTANTMVGDSRCLDVYPNKIKNLRQVKETE